MSNAIEITSQNFDNTVEKGLVLVDFWASWCGPCMMLGPVVEQLAEELDGKVTVGKVNVDEEQELAVKFGVMSIPTLVLFKDGAEVTRSVGVVPKAKLLEMIEKA
ncbi:MAG: thioredoxin [Oscillospiraceae bacterium]|nr:thioredoxin [Oscillospiraceae bacterium]